jgi:RNA polymerase sigma-70 factor (ECF subfamily)
MAERLTPQMEAEDAPDVERARAGDEDAFRRLVERHSPVVFRLAFRMLGNEHDAEDAVQEAFLKAHRALPEFESRSRFSSWLHRITVNCSYDVLRRRARRAEDPLETPGDDDAPSTELAALGPLPDRLLFGKELDRRMRVALARLSDLERSVFLLRHHEGLALRDIGDAMGLDTNATKHALFRAVRKVREVMTPLLAAGA